MISALLLIAAFASGAGPTGQVAYVAGAEQEDRSVHVLDLETGKTTQVGAGGRNGAPVWSPAGDWLAHEHKSQEGIGIRIVRPDGTEGRELQTSQKWNWRPRWSPDGSKIAYMAGKGPESSLLATDLASRFTLHVYDLASNTSVQWGGECPSLMRPIWIEAFSGVTKALMGEKLRKKLELSEEDIPLDGYLAAIGLTGAENRLSTAICIVLPTKTIPLPPELVSSKGDYEEWGAEISPKGDKLVFESNDGGDREIFVLSFRHGGVDISNHRAADWNPVWGPRGRWIAFESFRSGRRGVYRAFADTVRVYPVAASEAYDNWAPAWSPDGKWMAYVSDRTGHAEIFATEVSSGKTVQLTDGDLECLAPAWRPEEKE
jgi:Tol biopolymer transport system component